MAAPTKPNQHLVPLITYLALVPLVYFVPDFVAQFLPANKLLNVIVAVGVIVPIISYMVIPISLKCLHRKIDNTSHV
jgi:antibiotic biosynthesis monooxygenase (ABM) superfamily enzyme